MVIISSKISICVYFFNDLYLYFNNSLIEHFNQQVGSLTCTQMKIINMYTS